MKKILTHNQLEIEKIIINNISTYYTQNRQRIILLIILINIVYISTKIPYLNLFFKPVFLYPITVAIGIKILNFKIRTIIYLIIGMFVISAVLTVMRNSQTVEMITNTIYFMLWLAWYKKLRSILI